MGAVRSPKTGIGVVIVVDGVGDEHATFLTPGTCIRMYGK